jgi:hypothetical protein
MVEETPTVFVTQTAMKVFKNPASAVEFCKDKGYAKS